MVEKDTIDSIISTYEIPGKFKKRIASIAHKRAKNFYISDYSEIYRYISFLVERFQMPYQERFFTRLDAPIKSDSKNPFHELIGYPDCQGHPEESPDKISINDIFDILRNQVDILALESIHQLWYRENNMGFNIPSEYLAKNSYKIQQRLEKLIKEYEKTGGFLIPRRPSIEIKLSPLLIRLGRRTYNQNPLEFFRKHPLHYGWITKRTDLFKFDPGLYESLRRWDQLELAIPDTIPPGSSTKFSQRKINRIIKSFKKHKIVQRVANELKVSRAVVDRYLEENNLRTPRKTIGRPPLPEDKIKQIIESSKKHKYAGRAGRELDVTRWSVTKYWRLADIPIQPKGNTGEKQQII